MFNAHQNGILKKIVFMVSFQRKHKRKGQRANALPLNIIMIMMSSIVPTNQIIVASSMQTENRTEKKKKKEKNDDGAYADANSRTIKHKRR